MLDFFWYILFTFAFVLGVWILAVEALTITDGCGLNGLTVHLYFTLAVGSLS